MHGEGESMNGRHIKKAFNHLRLCCSEVKLLSPEQAMWKKGDGRFNRHMFSRGETYPIV